jgi:hypothetical protein
LVAIIDLYFLWLGRHLRLHRYRLVGVRLYWYGDCSWAVRRSQTSKLSSSHLMCVLSMVRLILDVAAKLSLRVGDDKLVI